jgi:hypothetical protein
MEVAIHLADEQINKIHTMEYYSVFFLEREDMTHATAYMNLKDSETDHKRKKHCMISFR